MIDVAAHLAELLTLGDAASGVGAHVTFVDDEGRRREGMITGYESDLASPTWWRVLSDRREFRRQDVRWVSPTSLDARRAAALTCVYAEERQA